MDIFLVTIQCYSIWAIEYGYVRYVMWWETGIVQPQPQPQPQPYSGYKGRTIRQCCLCHQLPLVGWLVGWCSKLNVGECGALHKAVVWLRSLRYG